MIRIFLFICFTSAVIICSCDPMRRLEMKNATKGDASFRWTLKEADSLGKSPFYMNNSRVAEFKLKNRSPYNFVNMSFGMGTWTPEYLKIMTERLESLLIKSPKDSVLLSSSDAIYDYLFRNRKGYGKSKIVLTLRE